MPTEQQIADFLTAFNKLHTDVTNDQLPDMDTTNDAGNNVKLKKVVNDLIAKLEKNIYKAHVDSEITALKQLVTEADGLTNRGEDKGGPDHAGAFTKLKKARTDAITAMSYLDDFAKYKIRSAKAHGVSAKAKKYKPNDLATWKSNTAGADSKADSHNYVGANSDIDAVILSQYSWTRGWVNDAGSKILGLRAKDAKVVTYLDSLLTSLDTIKNSMDTNLLNDDLVEVLMGYLKFLRGYEEARKLAERRAKFETQLALTKTAVEDSLDVFSGANPVVALIKKEQDALKERMANAIDQASLANRQVEIGTKNLEKIKEDADELESYGLAVQAFEKKVVTVQAAYDTDIKDHANKDTVILAAIKDIIDRAKKLGEVPATASEANTLLDQATRDINSAKAAFDASTLFSGIENGLDSTNAADRLGTLKTKFTEAKTHTDKDVVLKTGGDDKELDIFITKYGDNLSKVQTKVDTDPTTAIDDIKSAATDLNIIFQILSLEDSYKKDLKGLTDRYGVLDSANEADKIRAKITALGGEDATGGAIGVFTQKHNTRAWKDQADQLKIAVNVAKGAEEALELRKKYEARETLLIGVDGISGRLKDCNLDTDDKNEVIRIITAATNLAANPSLLFDKAHEKLDEAVAKMESFAIKKLASGSDGEKLNKIKAAAAKMMKNGSAEELDKLIKSLPDSVGTDVIQALAKERFDFKLSIEEGESTGFVLFGTRFFGEDSKVEATKAAKRMMEMMALVPDHVMGNPSIDTVKREDPDGPAGGFYRPSESLIVMKSRPGKTNQQFGTREGCLPMDNVPDACKPVNEDPVDYFNFATLHEVGHAIDDNLGFMSRNGKGAEFGTWKMHGGDVSEIVDAVAAEFKAPTLKAEIKELILGSDQVVWPTENPTGAVDNAVNKIKAWYNLAKDRGPGKGAWWHQDESDKITLGDRIYQEAYSNNWVSYKADARKYGITGYQFRAPGEWFAELYAAYYIKPSKLKPAHPAVNNGAGWLPNLKTS